MKVTDVKIKPLSKKGHLKALVDVVLDNSLIICNIKILDGEKGLFFAMPSRRGDKGYIDFVHPINTETRKMLHDAIFSEYEKAVKAHD